jgi:hypothetical protein
VLGRRWRAAPRWLLLAVAALPVLDVALMVPRGAVWPWTATASAPPPACTVLDAAGLERYWPAASRRKILDEPDRTPGDRVERTRCEWFEEDRGGPSAPFLSLVATVGRYGGDATTSPVNDAHARLDLTREALTGSRDVSGRFDEAFVAPYGGGGVQVWARRANMIVSVAIVPVGDGAVPDTIGRDLVAAMLGRIRFG